MAKRTAMILLALALGAGTLLWAGDATINISDESKQALKLVRMVRPQYPPEAKQAGIQGTVLLHVKVATDGTVKEIVVKEGEPKLVEATVEAVRQWEYEPVKLDGKAIEASTDVTVNFKLSEKK
ncbi:MAG: energy transducer TonB [Acidobacteria bacterium]|nr:energy transducer TonB [Acidobacteriota bacterium]